MDFEVLFKAFAEGGWPLLICVIVISAVIFISKKILSRMKEMETKIDSLRDEVTSLKVGNERYLTAIKSCTHEDCKVKQLFGSL